MIREQKRKIELLAPAKDLATAIDAIDCGADAVYIGAGKFGAMDVALGNLVSQGITKAIDGFKDLAKFAADAYKAVDEGGDNVIRATGATGKEAEALQESYKNVAKTFKGDFGTIGSVLGEVNTRFGYTGTKLEETTACCAYSLPSESCH